MPEAVMQHSCMHLGFLQTLHTAVQNTAVIATHTLFVQPVVVMKSKKKECTAGLKADA